MAEQGIDLATLRDPVCLYGGSVRAASRLFPANVNVAVALSLAGIGPDLTQYEVWADPHVSRNTHVVRVEVDESSFEVTVRGVPSEENPATGKLTPLSALATLRGLVATMRVGTFVWWMYLRVGGWALVLFWQGRDAPRDLADFVRRPPTRPDLAMHFFLKDFNRLQNAQQPRFRFS